MAETNRVALVTGAGSGIGRAASLALQGAGYSVVLAGRRKEELEKTAAAASATGGRMLPVPVDISQPEAVQALFAKLFAEFGRLDLLFNNAGVGTAGPIWTATSPLYERRGARPRLRRPRASAYRHRDRIQGLPD